MSNYVTFGIISLLLSGCICTQTNLPERSESQVENDTAESSQNGGLISQQSYEEIAGRRYGGDVDFLINEPGTHVLCITRARRVRKPVPVLASRTKFFVFDLSRNEILFEDSLENARVFWEDETHVKVLVTPGIVQGVVPREYGYRYDVVSGRKELLGP